MADTSQTDVVNKSESHLSPKQKVLSAVSKHSHLEKLKWCTDVSKVTVEEIGDGNLNNVFRILSGSDSNHSVVVKHAPPFIKCLGPDYPLHEERGELEYKVMCKFHTLSPGSIPEPIFYDETLRVVCAEDLRDYSVYRKSLIAGQMDEECALKLARDIAIIHRDTHVSKLGVEAIEQMNKEFQNDKLVALTEKYVFTDPFDKNDATNTCSDALKPKLDWLYEDQEVLQAASNMKKVFLEKKEALLHGDLHTGSIMVKDHDAKMIDCEFSFVGPCAFDIGSLIANYIFTYYCHLMCPTDNDDHRVLAYKIVDIANQTVEEYFDHMTSSPEDTETFQAKFISEVAGFAGCEIVRRLVGAAHVEEFEHTPSAEVDALGAGVRLLKGYNRIHSIGTLMLIALMLA